MASEMQLKAPLFGQDQSFLPKKVGFSTKQLGLSFQKSTYFSAKTVFPPKKWLFLAKGAILFEKGGTMGKKFEGINFGPNIFGQQLLELFHELSDIFTQVLLTK